MPTALDVHLLAPVQLRPSPARLHGLACALVEGAGADHLDQVKPWTVWPLRTPDRPEPAPVGAVRLVLRVNWLRDDDPSARAPMPGSVRIGPDQCRVEGVQVADTSYASLLRSTLWPRVAATFETPTTFSRNGRDVPLPDPVLVYGSLARRWNQFCDEGSRIDDDDVARLLGLVILTRMRGQTEAVGDPNRASRVGFVGTAAYALMPGAEPVDVAHLTALSRAAEYLGVGRGTTRGQGVVTVRSA